MARRRQIDWEDGLTLVVVLMIAIAAVGLILAGLGYFADHGSNERQARTEQACRNQAEQLRPQQPDPKNTSGQAKVGQDSYDKETVGAGCVAIFEAAGIFDPGAGQRPPALPLIMAAVATFVATLMTLVLTVRTGRGTRVTERAYLQARLSEAPEGGRGPGRILKFKNVGKSTAWVHEYRIAVVGSNPEPAVLTRQFQTGLTRADRMIGAGKSLKLAVDISWFPPQSWLLVVLVYHDVFGKMNEAWFGFSRTADGKYRLKQDGYRRRGLKD